MTDHTLHGNCTRCPSCEMRRDQVLRLSMNQYLRCNQCDGFGLLPRPVEEIVVEAAAWGREVHWPAFDERVSNPMDAIMAARRINP